MNCDRSVGGRGAASHHIRLAIRALTSPLRHHCIGALFVILAVLGGGNARPVIAASAVPRLDHVIVVVMENKTYDQVRSASFTASLITQSSSFSRSYALTHPSQPNYLALWSGSAQGVVDDNCPPSGSPFHSENLGHACETAGLSWKAYCENLPSPGSAACSGPLYLRRHAPWTDFSNLTHSNEVPFTQLAFDESLGTLPTLAFVIPNTCDDTHDSNCSVAYGDAWLQRHLPPLLRAAGSNAVLILTWDEDDGSAGNHILTVFAGPRVRPGYVSSTRITHDTVLRTICAALALPAFGAAVAESVITDVWTPLGNDSVPDDLALHSGMSLSIPTPNPSDRGIRAELHLSRNASIDVAIYDTDGRRVCEVLRGAFASTVHLAWDGHTRDGRPAPAGIYFLRVRTNAASVQRRFARLN